MPYISSGAPECLSCTRPQESSPVHLTRTIGMDSTFTSLLAGNTPVSACDPRSRRVVSFSFPQIRQRWISVYIAGKGTCGQEMSKSIWMCFWYVWHGIPVTGERIHPLFVVGMNLRGRPCNKRKCFHKL